MYREQGAVECAACGKLMDATQADIVDYGTGFRCFRCSTAVQIDGHLAESARQERQREGSDENGILAVLTDLLDDD
jgi:hypothetical protein